MALVNAVFLAINLTNPWLSLAGNGLALFTFAQNSPLPEFKKNAFPCSIFDKALYDSSLMSEELWAEFKLAGYYNDNDQLNDKFFQDYKDKKLLIPEKFKPYEAGIYEAFDIYLKENAEKFPTQNINPAAQRQPLSAILPQTKWAKRIWSGKWERQDPRKGFQRGKLPRRLRGWFPLCLGFIITKSLPQPPQIDLHLFF